MILLFAFYFLCLCFQVLYQLRLLFAIIAQLKINANIDNNVVCNKSVSIVICAKNEAVNLTNNLPFILSQKKINFEIIIVDDGSTDNTMTVIETYQKEYQNIQIVHIPANEKIGFGKKYALQKGIVAAKNDYILLTDADCVPASDFWIYEMLRCASSTKKIVLGVSPYYKTKGILNGLIAYETAQTALQYLGFALLGNPYMSVGRNVLYDAKLLKTLQWSTDDYAIASGDDDLAIQQLATAANTTISLNKNSFTYSEAPKTWKAWIAQKLRHYQTGVRYKMTNKIWLGVYLTTKLMLYALALIITVYSFYFVSIKFGTTNFLLNILLFIVLFCLYLLPYQLLNMLIQFLYAKKTNISIAWRFIFLYDMLYCFFTIMLGVISNVKQVTKWK